MKINLQIPAGLKRYFDHELELAANALHSGRLAKAWYHLERAHILGQAYPAEHTYAHWKMLQFGIRIKSKAEVRGQLLRLLVGGVKSFVGVIPTGNTGGANVDPLQPMEIPEDLKLILSRFKK
ncbi:DUF3703 domain-containing protein [Cesiribacter sp. SM1]|uniref:DUF3703 domain-containing protein n=1 Tax=Cesiribacter sp. SM1 TaxID=2861196 RepID=UPI001CD2A79D|nr:DUF3703 domain-containing protein [Cesiribacter sp. SM1]